MSDLNCGCGCDDSVRCGRDCGCDSGFFGGNNSCLWIILLLIFCGGCGNSRWGDRDDRCGCGCNDSCLWIILLLIFCGGCGNRCGC
ncbi:MAG: chorion class high-cysteine HCB protein 13 [Lachnospiraceae bacterium]